MIDRGPDALTVTVRDDGQGLGEFTAGNGIRGMSERAAEWGGQLSVTSLGVGAGTVVTAVLPWPRSAKAESDTGFRGGWATTRGWYAVGCVRYWPRARAAR